MYKLIINFSSKSSCGSSGGGQGTISNSSGPATGGGGSGATPTPSTSAQGTGGWQPKPLTDLKISSIYNRSAPEAPAELFR